MKQSNGNVSRNDCCTPSSNTRPTIIKNNFFATRNNFNQSSKKAKDIVLNYGDVVFVKKWVDYSSKYGLGYLLSNGCTGIYFNDSSKMILHSDTE